MLLVLSFSKAWPALLPQHGPGPKHERAIRLAPWQREITQRHPRELVRGLIHSDGCRFIARQRCRGVIYSYPRYTFKNLSQDILAIFCEHLDLLGVEWSRAAMDHVQVARRRAVETLDSFVGPKW